MSDRAKRSSAPGRSRRAPKAVSDAVTAPGRALDADVRTAMESKLGHSFADVRIHADAQAADAARSIGADAFAVGTHIIFAEGRYAPGTWRGRALLAHELAHVAQQGQEQADATDELEIAAGGDAVEAEANDVAFAYAASDAPEYLTAALAGGADAGRARALAEFRRTHTDDLLERYRAALAEPRRPATVKQSSPLLEVRRAACGRSSEGRERESREELARDLPGDDEMVRQVLAFFYPDLLPPTEVNPQLRQLAAVMLAEAIRGSRAMDYVPRPPSRPSPGWLFTEAVKIAWRRGRDEGIYEAVRVTVARAHRSEYELAKEGL